MESAWHLALPVHILECVLTHVACQDEDDYIMLHQRHHVKVKRGSLAWARGICAWVYYSSLHGIEAVATDLAACILVLVLRVYRW